jgi:hypothetical protein
MVDQGGPQGRGYRSGRPATGGWKKMKKSYKMCKNLFDDISGRNMLLSR